MTTAPVVNMDPGGSEPIDPDIDPHSPTQGRELLRTHGAVLAAIAAGGGLGALARYGLVLLWPVSSGGFPWATFAANVIGCFLIGVLMVAITDIWTAHPLVRPFLGVGVLGGFTTFSAYANDTRALLQPGTIGIAFAYLAATLIGALLATLTAMRVTRAVYEITRRRRPGMPA